MTRLTFPAFGVTTQRVVEVAAVNPEVGGEQPLKRRWQFNQVPRRCFFQNGHGSDHRDTPASGFTACLTFVNQDQVGPEFLHQRNRFGLAGIEDSRQLDSGRLPDHGPRGQSTSPSAGGFRGAGMGQLGQHRFRENHLNEEFGQEMYRLDYREIGNRAGIRND